MRDTISQQHLCVIKLKNTSLFIFPMEYVHYVTAVVRQRDIPILQQWVHLLLLQAASLCWMAPWYLFSVCFWNPFEQRCVQGIFSFQEFRYSHGASTSPPSPSQTPVPSLTDEQMQKQIHSRDIISLLLCSERFQEAPVVGSLQCVLPQQMTACEVTAAFSCTALSLPPTASMFY